MATNSSIGSARFEFTSISGMTSPFLLAAPLSILRGFQRVRHAEQRYVWRSMDRTGRNVVTVASTMVDIVATIRMDDQPDRLRKFIRHAMDGDLANLVYKPTSGSGGTTVSIDGPTSVEVVPDRDRGGAGEWETSIQMVLSEDDLGDLV